MNKNNLLPEVQVTALLGLASSVHLDRQFPCKPHPKISASVCREWSNITDTKLYMRKAHRVSPLGFTLCRIVGGGARRTNGCVQGYPPLTWKVEPISAVVGRVQILPGSLDLVLGFHIESTRVLVTGSGATEHLASCRPDIQQDTFRF